LISDFGAVAGRSVRASRRIAPSSDQLKIQFDTTAVQIPAAWIILRSHLFCSSLEHLGAGCERRQARDIRDYIVLAALRMNC
jgi:hypothetical protein